MQNPANQLRSVKEARRILGGIGHTKFYSLVRDGKLRLIKIGRRSFVDDPAIQNLIDDLRASTERAK